MDQRVFHGQVTPEDFARALVAEFDRGDLRARKVGRGGNLVVQIASPIRPRSGGRTAVSVHLLPHEDGVLVRVGQQEWLGVAASLGVTALGALRNPFSLLSRLDDVAQDIASMQLAARVWQTVERTARSLGASHDLSERLRRVACEYCDTANPVGEASCVACGAPLGQAQPTACSNCGFVSEPADRFCSNCGEALS